MTNLMTFMRDSFVYVIFWVVFLIFLSNEDVVSQGRFDGVIDE